MSAEVATTTPVVGLAGELARNGRLYPSVILHGGDLENRRRVAEALARNLLCEQAPEQRPCGACRHCRRIELDADSERFHPDLIVIKRDLRTSTSVEGVKGALRSIQSAPFEARGQVVVVTDAESLSGAAANALLKSLEEPGLGAPRNFLLLASAAGALLPTLRSRSLAVYLGGGVLAAACRAGGAAFAEEIGEQLLALLRDRSAARLVGVADLIVGSGADFSDPRSEEPWARAAAACAELARSQAGHGEAPALLELALGLLNAPEHRVRGIPANRIVQGLLSRCVAGR